MVLVVLMAGCGRKWLNPPTYPQSENIQIGAFATADAGTASVRTITFETEASPEEIFTFYQQALSDTGWYADYQGGGGACRATVSFGDRPIEEGFIKYCIGVEAEQTIGKETRVTLLVWRGNLW
jgi:hypothetical protein